jgi:hypothetical protein
MSRAIFSDLKFRSTPETAVLTSVHHNVIPIPTIAAAMPTNRLLIVSPPNTGVLDLVRDLTGTAPTPDISGSCAGLTHAWDVKTAYYSASVPIWIDEIPDLEEWKATFLEPEAKEVVEAVGAWVYVSWCGVATTGAEDERCRETELALKAIQEITEQHAGYARENVAMLAVYLPAQGSASGQALDDTTRERLDDMCIEHGFEFIDYSATGVNAFGEKQGFERMREALEANDWSGTSHSDEEDNAFRVEDDGVGTFGDEEVEMSMELFGLKSSLLDRSATPSVDDDDDGNEDDVWPDESVTGSEKQQAAEVDDLEAMMSKLLAVKEQSAGLPEAQRKKVAARAVREVMGSAASGG